MHKSILRTLLRTVLISSALMSLLFYMNWSTVRHPIRASQVPITYDISQWQGYLNDNEARNLKSEVPFIIIRGSYGDTVDSQASHNITELKQYHIPYGVYSYSTYTGPAQAEQSARTLYDEAPHAKFYVNDAEENDAGLLFNASTTAWSNEMHHLTHRPVILYSDLYFMNEHTTPQTQQSYDTIWLADYSNEPDPSYHYDLWQYTDHQYSPALNQYVDASTFPENAKPLSYWTHGKRHFTEINTINHRTQNKIKNAQRTIKKIKRSRPKVNRRKYKHISQKKLNDMDYYYSPKIHDLIVTRRGGINLYYQHRNVHHVARFHIIPVKFFNLHTGKRYWSRGVTEYHHHEANFTASKDDVDIMMML